MLQTKHGIRIIKTVRNEISKYSKKVSSKKEIVVFTKIDLINANSKIKIS